MSDLTPATPTVASTVAGERAMLEGWLDRHREVLLWKCDGLTDDQLRTRSAAPSTLSLLGLVRHMSEVERGWFAGFAGVDEGDIYCSEDNLDGDFDDVDTADPAADIATFRTEVQRCRSLVADRSLDETYVHRRGAEISLRWIFVHMIEEYARHNGHADLIRERIDGVTGDFPGRT